MYKFLMLTRMRRAPNNLQFTKYSRKINRIQALMCQAYTFKTNNQMYL